MTYICVYVSVHVCACMQKNHSQCGILGFPTDSTASWGKLECRSTSLNYSPILNQIMSLGRLTWAYWVNEAILLILWFVWAQAFC